jgi:hypothetical protein
MNIVERYKKPTPRFFKILRNIGIALATAGGAIIAAPIAVSQAAVKDEDISEIESNPIK